MLHNVEHVHFIGIGGYGMSAIARVMLDMGFQVSGSDVQEKELTNQLLRRGATIYIGHEATNVNGADVVVYSSGVPKDNIEIETARKKRIPLLHRSEMLARLLNERKGIAITGAHGKTTTSSMVAHVLEASDVDPTYVIGGEVIGLDGNAKAGQSDYVVAEADESDGSFLAYYPYIGVVTNIEADHLENYEGSFAKLQAAYRQFFSQVRTDGVAIVCNDDAYIRELLPAVNSDVITYGIEQPSDYRATNIHTGDGVTTFTVSERGRQLGEVTLTIPGIHNVLNALAVIAVSRYIGLSFDKIAQALPRFQGTKRRFQIVGQAGDIVVVDDYAHHPTEIRATIEAAKSLNKRIIAIFQPQRYSRTYFLLDEFSHAFSGADHVVITNIYAPVGEKEIEGVNARRLSELIRENSNPNVTFCPTKEDVERHVLTHAQSGDLILTMGAGDIWMVAKNIAQKLQQST